MNKERDYFWIFLLFAVWIFFFRDVISGGKIIFLKDVGFLYYPYKVLIAKLIHKGIFPFWNPYINCGEPILSNPQYMLFYPTYFLYYLFPLMWFFQFHFIFHILVASVGFYFFIKHHIKDNFSSFLSSLFYSYSGFSASHLLFQNLIVYFAFLPWILILLRKIFNSKFKFIPTIFLAFLFSLLVFSMEPFYFLSVILIAFLYFVFEGYTFNLRKLVLFFLIFFSISSIQILPSLGVIREFKIERSIRNVGYSFDVDCFYDFISGKGVKGEFFYVSFYVGTIFFLIFLKGILGIDGKRMLFSLLVIFLLVFLSGGGNLYQIFRKVPYMSFGRFPIKFFFPIFFIFCFYFSMGLKSLIDSKEKPILIFCLASFIIFLSLFFSFFYEALYLALFLLIFLFLKERKKYLFKVSLFFLFLGILYFNFPEIFSNKDFEFEAPMRFVLHLGKKDNNFRVTPDFNLNIFSSFRTKNYNEAFYRREFCRDFSPAIYEVKEGFLIKVGGFGNKDSIVVSNTLVAGRLKMKEYINFYSHTGVRFLISPEKYSGMDLYKSYRVGDNVNVFVYDLKTPPIFHFSNRVFVVENLLQKLFLWHFDDRKIILLREDKISKVLKNISFGNGKILSVENKINKIKFYVKAPKVSLFTFKEVYYPGWRVFVDDREVRNLRINGLFQGCIVPKGYHTLLFKYEPVGWHLARILFVMGVLLSVFFFLLDLILLDLKKVPGTNLKNRD